MKKIILLLIILSVLNILGLAVSNPALAEDPPPEEEECIPGPVQTSVGISNPFRCNDFPVYKCLNNACGKSGGAMEQGIEWYMCETETTCWADGCNDGCDSSTYRISGPHGPDQVQPYDDVPDYQVCPATNNNWGATPPIPECSGSCYLAPNLKTLDDNSLLPKNVSEGAKYKLPINFGWEDNVEKEVIKSPNFCAVSSYEFNIVDPPLSKIVTSTQLQTTEDSAYKLECRLKSNNAYQWRARACLDAGGSDCGEWPASQNFNTSLTPELVSPYDPDWQGSFSAENIATPITLDWCDVDEAESWLLQIHLTENNEEKCHPWLTAGTDCKSWPTGKERKPPPYEEKPELLSEFFDKKGFFTKDTEYSWRLAICLREDNADCGAFSQQWQLKTSDVPLTDFMLIYPPNDPQGETPVGLPINFYWANQPGTNSFNYTVGPLSGTALSSGISFDYNQLSLNAFYQWTVKPCWDYEGKKCETDLTKTGYFKTTGRPPTLDYPSPPEDNNIPIPVNFNWEDVPGAKSYILKVWGEELNFEEPINDKSEFSLDFPKFNIRQEKTYAWQVKTCVREDGRICGAYSSQQNFKTFKLPSPGAPKVPQNKGVLLTDEHFLSWKKVTGAKAYQYKVKLLSVAPEEQNQECSVPPLQTVPTNSSFVELACLGQYQWETRSCLDSNCQETSDWSGPWSFALSEGGAAQGGLVPCGRKADSLNTPWNEREPCQIKHGFLLVKIMVDFLLLRLIPLALVLLTFYSGLIFYLSLGGTSALARVISLWKSAGIGLLIVSFAWTLVNLILKLAGYQIGIFGNWHQF